MSVAENYENFAEPGGVLLWHTDPKGMDPKDNFLVRLRLKDGSHTWSSAWFTDLGHVDYELAYVESDELKGAEIVGYCRGPDPNSNVAYQLGDPGEGLK